MARSSGGRSRSPGARRSAAPRPSATSTAIRSWSSWSEAGRGVAVFESDGTVAWSAPSDPEQPGRLRGAVRLRRRRRRRGRLPRRALAADLRPRPGRFPSCRPRGRGARRAWWSPTPTATASRRSCSRTTAYSPCCRTPRPPRLRRRRGHLAPVAADLEPVRVPRLQRQRRRLDPRHRDAVAGAARGRTRSRASPAASVTPGLRVREAGPHRVLPARRAGRHRGPSHGAHRQRRGRHRRQRRPRSRSTTAIPRAGSPRLGTVHTSAVLAPGAYEDVVLTLPAAATTSRSIWIAADDFGNRRGMTTESDEDNNVYDSGRALLGAFGRRRSRRHRGGRRGSRHRPGHAARCPGRSAPRSATRATPRRRARSRSRSSRTPTGTASTIPGSTSCSGRLTRCRPRRRARTSVATASVSGVVRFAGNVVHAMADSAGAIAETNEANNVGLVGGVVPGRAAGGDRSRPGSSAAGPRRRRSRRRSTSPRRRWSPTSTATAWPTSCS